jgi:hypothetical protein
MKPRRIASALLIFGWLLSNPALAGTATPVKTSPIVASHAISHGFGQLFLVPL